MTPSAAAADDDSEVVVVGTVRPNSARDRQVTPNNVIVLDTSRPQHAATTPMEPIVIDEVPRKRRRRDQAPTHPLPSNSVSHPPHVIIVDDSDSPPHPSSVFSIRGSETRTTPIEQQSMHLHQRNASRSPHEEDVIEMAASGPRLAPSQPPPPPHPLPPPPVTGPGAGRFPVESLVSPTHNPSSQNHRQNMPPLPDFNPLLARVNRLTHASTLPHHLHPHNLELPSIPPMASQPRPQSSGSRPQHTPRLVELDQILARNRCMSTHGSGDLQTNSRAIPFTPALRPSSVNSTVYSDGNPLRHNPSVPRRYVHLERNQGAMLGRDTTPSFVHTGTVRRSYPSSAETPSRHGIGTESRHSAVPNHLLGSTEPRVNPLRHNNQSETSQSLQNVNNTVRPVEGQRHNYSIEALTNPTTAGGNRPDSSVPGSVGLLGERMPQVRRMDSPTQIRLMQYRRERELRHLRRVRYQPPPRPSPANNTRVWSYALPSMEAINAQNREGAEQVIRRSAEQALRRGAEQALRRSAEQALRRGAMRMRAARSAATGSGNTSPHVRGSHEDAPVVHRMIHVNRAGLQIHYFHEDHDTDHFLDYEHLIRLDDQLVREKNRADKDQIDSLPTKKATVEDKEIRCCICMCDVEEGEELRILPCSHKYHKSCIDEWLTYNGCCPVDKKRIAPNRPRRRSARLRS